MKYFIYMLFIIVYMSSIDVYSASQSITNKKDLTLDSLYHLIIKDSVIGNTMRSYLKDSVSIDTILKNSKYNNFNFNFITFNYDVVVINKFISNILSFISIVANKDFIFEKNTVKRDTVTFYQANFKGKVSFKKTDFRLVRYLDFREATFDDDVNFDFTNLPDTIDFSRVKIKDNKKINLMYASKLDSNKNHQKCYIKLCEADINSIIFNYNKFKIIFDDTADFDKKTYVYDNLKRKYKELCMNSCLQEVDIDYQSLENHNKGGFYIIWDFIERHWWNYGYNKEKVFYLAILFFAIYVVISLIVPKLSFCELQKNVYSIKDDIFIQIYLVNDAKRIIHTILYIGYIFLSFKLDMKDFKNPIGWRTYYIILIFISGLLFVTFTASIILGSGKVI